LNLHLPLINPPDPVTLAFVGLWVAPAEIVVRYYFAAFSAPASKADWASAVVNFVVGGLGLATWIRALTGQIDQRGEFISDSSSTLEIAVGTAGLAVLFVSTVWLWVYYFLRRQFDLRHYVDLLGGPALAVGILVSGLIAGLD
jgi:hypothetical protein